MDICIGGILNGKVRKNNENYFSIGNPHSDDGQSKTSNISIWMESFYHFGCVMKSIFKKPPE